MSNVGPVCHIPPTNQPANPQVKNIPGVAAAPTDLASALQAIRNLQQIVRYLTGQIVNNNITNVGGSGAQKTGPSSYIQDAIVTEKKRIYQNNDTSSPNYIDIDQTNSLTMRDKNTGSTWTWNRNGG